jgi:hypothetical protein
MAASRKSGGASRALGSSWALSPLSPPLTLAANAMVVAAAFIVFWVFTKVLQLRWRERHSLLLGAWAFAAALVLALIRSALPLILVGWICHARPSYMGDPHRQRR